MYEISHTWLKIFIFKKILQKKYKKQLIFYLFRGINNKKIYMIENIRLFAV